MSLLEDLKAQLENEHARHAKATLSEEESEIAKTLAQIAEKKAERLAAEKARRALRGAELEAEARKAAAGKHLVKYFDLAELLPDADPEKLPGEGMLVVRSPATVPVDALGQFYREIEAHERPHTDIYVDLVCSSVVYPDLSNQETGMLFRNFLESSVGHGTAMTIGDVVSTLGGVRGKRTKRGRG